MRFAAIIRQEHAPARSLQPSGQAVPDEPTGDDRPLPPQAEELPLDQRVRMVGEW